MYKKVFIGIGSNAGDRRKNIINALKKIKSNSSIKLRKISSLYETEAMYDKNLPDFYNMVIEIETSLTPDELLNFLKEIEVKMGRKLKRDKRYEPRNIDLDIIAFQNVIKRTEKLSIPHKNMWERKFVLIPLQEIAPNYICPIKGIKISEMVSEINNRKDGIKKIGAIHENEL